MVEQIVTTLPLSTADFLSSVRSLDARVAVFDCDGTLWSGDAGSGFMKWSIETGLVSREVIDSIDGRYRGYLRGEVSELAICGEMVQIYQGLRESEMRQAARSFFAGSIERNIFPELRGLVEELRRAGVELWAVSSTNNWVIEEAMTRFGIGADHVLAARVRIADGVVTNELLDVPTDEGKAVSLQRAGVDRPDAVFGNSIHDVAMMELARRAFPVNPTPALVDRSLREGWPLYYPESVRDPAK